MMNLSDVIHFIRENSPKTGFKEKTFLNMYPEIHKAILDNTNFLVGQSIPFTERIYVLVNGITSQPLCKICPEPVRVMNIKNVKQYAKYCSYECRSISFKENATNAARIGAAKMKANGGEGYAKREVKTKETNLKRYGVENVMDDEYFRNLTKKPKNRN